MSAKIIPGSSSVMRRSACSTSVSFEVSTSQSAPRAHFIIDPRKTRLISVHHPPLSLSLQSLALLDDPLCNKHSFIRLVIERTGQNSASPPFSHFPLSIWRGCGVIFSLVLSRFESSRRIFKKTCSPSLFFFFKAFLLD